MYDMMNTTGLGYGIFSGWALHWAFGTFWIIGSILFVAWAIKNLNGTMLRNWAIGLFIIGIIGTIITAPADIAVWRTVFGNRNGMMSDSDMMGRMMQTMMNHDEANPSEEHDEIEGMMRGILDGTGNRNGMMQ